MLRLVIEDDEGKTIVVPLIRDEITIGRKEGNIIRLTERNVSRHHARLVRAGDDGNPAVLVEDLDSYNGVRLNGDRVPGKCTMRPGDLVQIGDYSLALRVDAPAGSVEEEEAAVPTGVDAIPTALHRVESDQLDEHERGRLVVVSSNLAGQEYVIDRREAIVGRTDENDVVVNHRSISRNHAKIIVRDGVFTVIDLASSNGVRINGEAFGTAGLVNGDILQLGHVKLRFVAPGDTYVFTPADVSDVELDAGPSTARLVLIALLLVAVAVAAFLLLQQCEGPQAAAPKPAPVVTPAEPEAPPPPEPAVDVEKLMEEGKAHLRAEKWTEAANVFGRVLQSADNDEATDLRKQARFEADNKQRYDKLNQDVADEQWADAWLALEDFPETSIYHPRLDPVRPRVQKNFADSEVSRGKALLEQAGPEDLEGAQNIQSALAEKPFAKKQAEELRRAIDAEREAREKDAREAERPRPAEEKPDARPEERRPREPKPREKPARVERRAEPKEVAGESREDKKERYDALMAEALKLMARGQRGPAVRLLEQAQKLLPGAHTPHQRLCAIYKPMGQLQKALHHCKMWLAKEPNSGYKDQIRRQIQILEAELAQ